MIELFAIELEKDPEAARYCKDEVVEVKFAQKAGEIMSPEGPNLYAANDALVSGSTGNSWCVSRSRFDQRYEPLPPLVHGQDGAYRNRRIPVLAKKMPAPFAIHRSQGGDRLCGKAGDWLLQYAPGDYGIAEDERFSQVYRLFSNAD